MSEATSEQKQEEPPKKTSKEVADETECALGISAYLGDHQGFSAVSKARYSDFVVHEVGPDGRVARLESMNATLLTADEKPAEDAGDEAPRKRKREEEETDNGKAEPDWESLQTEFGKIVGEEASTKVMGFLKEDAVKAKETSESKEEEAKEPEKKKLSKEEEEEPKAKETESKDADAPKEAETKLYVALPPIPDKDTRRQVHQWIKSSSLHSIATADTADDGQGNKVIRFWPLRHESKMPNHKQFDRNGGRKSRGNRPPKVQGYLQFVLYKENCDTNTAVRQITQRMNNNNRGGRGGRRGRGRFNNRNDRVRVGYAGMKDKRGVTTQFMTLHQRSPHEITWVNQHNNSFHGGGTSSRGGAAIVRVGNFRQVKDELRLGRLNGNRFDVALRNVQSDSDDDLAATKAIVAESAKALAKNGFINYFGTQRFGKFHDTHLAGMAFVKGDFAKVVEIIMRPKEEEREDIRNARQKWQQRFDNLKPEDTEEARKKAESECAKETLPFMGRFMANEVAILNSLVRFPLDYQRAFSCINKTMRMMFLHAVQSLLWNKITSHRIEKMGLDVVVGDLVFTDRKEEDQQDSKEPSAVKQVTEEDIAAKRYSITDVVMPLLGTKSVKPNNECGDMFDPLLKENGLEADMFAKLQSRDITCPGDYRKILCRPSDVDFTIVEYQDPYEPLLQTDLMQVNSVQLGVKTEGQGAGEEGRKPLLGMVVGFTLPSSAYATIALRELMKKPTSTEYQRELGLGGPKATEDKTASHDIVDKKA